MRSCAERDAAVRAMRAQFDASGHHPTHVAIAKQFGISASRACDICSKGRHPRVYPLRTQLEAQPLVSAEARVFLYSPWRA